MLNPKVGVGGSHIWVLQESVPNRNKHATFGMWDQAKWASPPITLKHVLNIAGSSCLPIQPACVADRRRALATSGAILAERRSAELPKERFRDPQERQESSLGQGGFFKRLLNAGKLETLFCHSLALLEVMQFTTFGFLGLKSIYFITRPIKQSFHKKVSQWSSLLKARSQYKSPHFKAGFFKSLAPIICKGF